MQRSACAWQRIKECRETLVAQLVGSQIQGAQHAGPDCARKRPDLLQALFLCASALRQSAARRLRTTNSLPWSSSVVSVPLRSMAAQSPLCTNDVSWFDERSSARSPCTSLAHAHARNGASRRVQPMPRSTVSSTRRHPASCSSAKGTVSSPTWLMSDDRRARKSESVSSSAS